ncbi:sulfite exporter TauE/SafE family protein [Paracoccus sp. TK19116]|uniref:Probable membrane transporter protein n=1 Tax=Paracoccus albicereus TaxID=2922394 RepID=A0ABT1MPS5_9RHOB|nr:sulfite exporter TauE/SafE family protein [Paracoccus albicereus]MCQ0970302.1 sulfite exporter TauE/SafE family protein [Paracoccus albicereus]
MEATGWIAAVIAACAVGLSKGGLAMVATLAVPVLSLTMSPVQAAGLLLPVYIVSDMGGLLAFRRVFDRSVLARALPGAAAGVALGWATAHVVPEWGVTLLVGVIGLVFAVNALIRPDLASEPRPADYARGSLWGGLAGYTSFVSHSGAPPWQVYAQPLRLSPLGFAGTTTWFFAIVNLLKLPPYIALGQISLASMRVAMLLMPAALISVWVGLRIVRILPQKLFYTLITWGLLAISLRLIWQALAG